MNGMDGMRGEEPGATASVSSRSSHPSPTRPASVASAGPPFAARAAASTMGSVPITDERGATRLKSLLDHLDVELQVVAHDVRPHDLHYPRIRPDFSKFYCVYAGQGMHEAGDRRHPVRAGDLVFVPAGVDHVDNPVGTRTYSKIYCHFRAHSAGLDLAAFLDLPPVIRPPGFAAWKRRFADLLAHHAGQDPGDGLRANAGVRAILADYLALAPPDQVRFRWSPGLTKLDTVINALTADLRQDHRLEDLARLIQVHPNHLCRLFTRSVGQPPHQYLKQLRLRRAQDLLQTTDLAIETIATDTGFANVHHFTRAFSERFGVPPAQFRRSATPAR